MALVVAQLHTVHQCEVLLSLAALIVGVEEAQNLLAGAEKRGGDDVELKSGRDDALKAQKESYTALLTGFSAETKMTLATSPPYSMLYEAITVP